MSIAYSSSERSRVNEDTSTIRYKVVISKELGDAPIQLKMKTAGDPLEPGYYRIGMDLADYLREVTYELRNNHRWLRLFPLAWLLRWVAQASDAVIWKAKRMSVHL